MHKFILIVSVILTTGCTSKPSIKYADVLHDCLSDEDIEILNEACESFENKLAEGYPGKNMSNSYSMFLFDISKFNVPPTFCLNEDSEEMLHKLRTAGTFNKIWSPLSELSPWKNVQFFTSGAKEMSPPNEELKLFCIDPSKDYFDCISKQNKSAAISTYLSTIKSLPNISMTVTAFDLYQNLSQKDLENGLNRLIISLGFYYQMALLFE